MPKFIILVEDLDTPSGAQVQFSVASVPQFSELEKQPVTAAARLALAMLEFADKAMQEPEPSETTEATEVPITNPEQKEPDANNG
ncbi:MAG: hypothetical protein EBR82_32135 [Caulobacteraceae bacterium]|nr:hypothetical protein [Caulobacteraceae bacterium]